MKKLLSILCLGVFFMFVVAAQSFAITINPMSDQFADEGVNLQFTAQVSDGIGNIYYSWDFDGSNGIGEDEGGYSLDTVDYVYAATGTYEVTLKVEDSASNTSQTSFMNVIYDVPTTIYDIPDQSVTLGTTFDLSGTFHDGGTLNSHSFMIYWGDSFWTDATVSEEIFGPPGRIGGKDGTFSGSHDYAAIGFYGVDIELEDGTVGQSFMVEVSEAINPVPVPTTIWLLGSGLFGIVGIRRKMKK